MSFNSIEEAKEYSNLIKSQSSENLHKNFISSNWRNLSNTQKQTILQEVENRNSIAQGRKEPCQVVVTNIANDNGKKVYGNYNDKTQRININSSIDNPYHTLNTIYHEGQHAYQDHCVKQGYDPSGRYNKDTLDLYDIESKKVTRENKQSKENIGDYYNYKKVVSYTNSLTEIDSSQAGIENVANNHDLFKSDPKYASYLQEARDNLNKRQEMMRVSHMQMQYEYAVDESLNRGDISQKEANQLKTDCIQNTIQKDIIDKISKQESNLFEQERDSRIGHLRRSDQEKDELDKFEKEHYERHQINKQKMRNDAIREQSLSNDEQDMGKDIEQSSNRYEDKEIER